MEGTGSPKAVEGAQKRVVVFFGSLGSGKTEVAVNYALRLAQRGPVNLVDLDLVTPLFRSREAQGVLRGRGVQVVGPPPELWLADLPVLPAQIRAAVGFAGRVVLDVGGGEAGARVVGSLSAFLTPQECETLLVVNPYRPFTRTPAGIEAVLRSLERAAALTAAGLVSNPHLGPDTGAAEVLAGHRIVQRAAEELGLGIRFLCVAREKVGELAGGGVSEPVFPLTRFMKAPWELSVESQEG